MKKIGLLTFILTLLASICFASTSVKDFGAKGDGITDDTKAFNDALQAAHDAGGGVVEAPAGTYCIRGNIVIPSSVTLQGTWQTAPLLLKKNDEKGGTILQAYAGRGSNEGEPFIKLAGNVSTIRGVCIYYPEWSQETVPPVPYPPTIGGTYLDNATIENICLQNSYEGIHFDRVGRFYMNNVQGYPSWRGLFIDRCYDVGRIENIHFWPFGIVYIADDPYCEWINKNGVAFEFAKSDWQFATNTFCFGYGVGYKFSSAKDGPANGSFMSIAADCCQRAVLVEHIQGTGLAIVNGEFVGRWGSQDSIGIDIQSNANGKVSITNTAFWGPLKNAIKCDAPNATLSVVNNHFHEWDVSYNAAPAIDLIRGRAVISSNTFEENYLDIKIGKEMGSTIINSNLSKQGLKIKNESKGFVRLNDNEPKPSPMTRAEKKNYILNVGSKGDTSFFDSLYRGEPAIEWENSKGTKRWMKSDSTLYLPVVENQKYNITLDVFVPDELDLNGAGFYYNNKCIAIITKRGIQKIEAQITTNDDIAEISIKCKPWSPNHVNDRRKLSIALNSVQMQMEGANWKAASANR